VRAAPHRIARPRSGRRIVSSGSTAATWSVRCRAVSGCATPPGRPGSATMRRRRLARR